MDKNPPSNTENLLDAVVPALGELNRSAHASLRGYFFQVVHSAIEWLLLGESEVLVVEGREDLDRLLLSPTENRVEEVSETQLKDLQDAVNIRSQAVWESLFNFIKSYHFHRAEGRECRFLFTTTADVSPQFISPMTGIRATKKSRRLDLGLDVLDSIIRLENCEDTEKQILVKELRDIVFALYKFHFVPKNSLEEASNRESDDQLRAAELGTILSWFDSGPHWDHFWSVTKFRMGQANLVSLVEDLEERVGSSPDFSRLPPGLVARSLIYKVISAASNSDVRARCLTRSDLLSLALENEETLARWSQEVGLYKLDGWFQALQNICDRVSALEAQLAGLSQSPLEALKQLGFVARTRMGRVRIDIGGVEMPRTTLLLGLDEDLKRRNLILLGPPGSGKSALLRTYCERFTRQGGTLIWFHALSFNRRDLANLLTELNLRFPLDRLIEELDSEVLVVLDSVDQLHAQSAFSIMAELMDLLGIRRAERKCHFVITCQTHQWPRVDEEMNLDDEVAATWDVKEILRPTLVELDAVFRRLPNGAALRQLVQTKPLLQTNLKILDIVARRDITSSGVDSKHSLGEPAVADWFWSGEILKGNRKNARDALTAKLAITQADRLRADVSLTDLGPENASLVDELEEDRILVSENSLISFSHDLYADWGCLRQLVANRSRLGEFLVDRLDSPRWYRPLRLLGERNLDSGAVGEWHTLLTFLEELGDQRAGDLLLESVALSPNSLQHLRATKTILMADSCALLARLIGRFLVFATLPEPRMIQFGQALGEDTKKIAALYRCPNWPYWPPLITFLHENRTSVVPCMPVMLERLLRLWLDYTDLGGPLRDLAAELALDVGRLCISGRSKEQKKRFLELALLVARDLESQVIELVLEAVERTTSPGEYGMPSFLQSVDEESLKIASRPGPFRPSNLVREYASETILEASALKPMMTSRPDMARELILACLITPCNGPGNVYRSGLMPWAGDLATDQGMFPASPYRGPFLSFLHSNFEYGLDTILRLVDFAAEGWQARCAADPDRYVYDPCSTGSLEVSITGQERTLIGDDRVLGWSAGLGLPLPHNAPSCALMALEQHLYRLLDEGQDVVPQVEKVVEKLRSVPSLLVLLDLGRKEPSLFETSLTFLLGIPQLYFWEITVRSQSPDRSHLHSIGLYDDSLIVDLSRKFHELEHRKSDLRQVAARLFLENPTIEEYLSTRAEGWAEQARALEPGVWKNRLTELSLRFRRDSYSVHKNEDGSSYYVNDALWDFHQNSLHEFTAAQNQAAFALFPLKCRRMLEAGNGFPADELPDVLDLLKKVDEALFGVSDVPDWAASPKASLVDALAGGIAVLVCHHIDWLNAEVRRIAWVRTTLCQIIETPAGAEYLTPESLGEFDWDSFAVDAAVGLWSQDTDDRALREAIGRLVFSYHYVAVRRLFHLCGRDHRVEYVELCALRKLALQLAFVRRRHSLLHHLTSAPDGPADEMLEGHAATVEMFAYRKLGEFVELETNEETILDELSEWPLTASPPTVPSEWQVPVRTLEFFSGPDLKMLLSANGDTAEVKPEWQDSEESYRYDFLRQCLDFTVGRVDEEDFKYPDENVRFILDSVARGVSNFASPERVHGLIDKLLGLPVAAEDWVEYFCTSLYTRNLPDPGKNFLSVADYIATSSLVLMGSKWWFSSSVWDALLGTTHWARGSWNNTHKELSLGLWKHIETFIERGGLASVERADAVVSWLRKQPNNEIKLNALEILAKPIGGSSWQRNSCRERAEDALATLLTELWSSDKEKILADEEMSRAFRSILGWLANSQNKLGLHLVGEVGGL